MEDLSVAFDEDLPPVKCRSLDELEVCLDRIHAAARRPLLVCIDTPEHRLDIGLGMDPSFIIVNTQPADGEFWRAIGPLAGDRLVDVSGCGVHQQVEERYLLPLVAVRAAVRHFLTTKQRPTDLAWEDWNGVAV